VSEEDRSTDEQLTSCRMRLAGLRVSVLLAPRPLREAVDQCWHELTILTARGGYDRATVDELCERVAKLIDTMALL
jgi:hypothetical protein